MIRRPPAIVVALVGSACVKAFYHSASAAQLAPFLWPTARLCGWLTGAPFVAGPTGYFSAQLRFLIAPACAGVNFFIVAWLALAILRDQPLRSALYAYGATLAANTLRILGAIWLHLSGADRFHRIEGVVVYLGVLAVVVGLAARNARALAVALACYLAVTLLVPLARGAGARAAYWQHAAVVGGVTALFALGAFALRHRRLRAVEQQRLTATPNPFPRIR